MESRGASTGASLEGHWLLFDSFFDKAFSQGRDLAAITTMWRQIDEFKRGRIMGPSGTPGWIEELFAWVQREIEPYGLRLNAEFRHVNASPTFGLLRFETDRQAVWFKAVAEPN